MLTLVVIVAIALSVVLTNQWVYPRAYNAGTKAAQVKASASAVAAASASAAAIPPPGMHCPLSRSDEAIGAVHAGTGFTDWPGKPVLVVNKPMKSLLVIYTAARVFVRASVSGDLRVCGDGAVLVLETALPATTRIYIGGGNTILALVDGAPRPAGGVWASNKHLQPTQCYVGAVPKPGELPCSAVYAGPNTVIPTAASPMPTKTR